MTEDYLRVVRPNADAERAVIGAILVDADRVMPECEEMLSDEDFLISEYRTLYRTMSGYFVDGKPIDAVTLIAQHGNAYRETLVEAIQSMPSIRNWKSYAEIVRATAIRHRALAVCRGLEQEILGGANVAECQDISITLCESLNTTTHGNTLTPKQGLDIVLENSKNPRTYIRTGFARLDSYTYLSPGDFVVIGGRPSSGKTALTLQIALNMAKKHTVVYFSLETSGEKMYDRIVANYFDIPLGAIKAGEFDTSRVYNTRGEFENLKLHVVGAAGWTVGQMQAKAVQLKADVVFVDYLGLVDAEGASRYEKMTNISIALHVMAQTRKMAVIALSQLNREGKGEPDMSHLRESGQIEQDADVILLLHDVGEQEQFARKLTIAKNKEGRTGALRYAFDGGKQRFSEYEVRY